ncbi:MAG: T9SS type A sorting domain-containing protein [Candidatus Eisenbacteria sp.]|nr:T9SS type A sorting domain-containing protein [Candidatus Eisenbacteria bacterium]
MRTALSTISVDMLVVKATVLSVLLALLAVWPVLAGPPEIDWFDVYGDDFTYPQGRCVQATPDGGYIACGYAEAGFPGEDYFLVKVNSEGEELWTRRYDFNPGEGNELLYSVDLTHDGGYIATGYGGFGTNSYCFTIATDSLGNVSWTRTYDFGQHGQGHAIARTSDGGYIIAGGGFALLKIDSTGDEIWTRHFGGGGAYDVQQTIDGGYILTGDDGGSVKLVRTDADGDPIWTRVYLGGRGQSVRQTADSAFVVSGITGDFGSANRPFLIKVDAAGDTLWTQAYMTGVIYCVGAYVRQTTDGGYILAEAGSYEIYDYPILRGTDSEGNSLWTMTLPGFGATSIYSLESTLDDAYIVCGWDWPIYGGTKLYLCKTEPDSPSGIADQNPCAPTASILSGNSPNPFGHTTTISYRVREPGAVVLNIYNVQGQLVKRLVDAEMDRGMHYALWNGRNESDIKLSPGVYLYRIATGNGSATRMMILANGGQ